MDQVERLLAGIQAHSKEYIAISDGIWDRPEVAFCEKYASETLALYLRGQGFRIREGAGGLATAFTATYGAGGPVIGILGEYDALPGLSQAAGLSYRREAEPGGPGHGCGHNLLGTGAAAAAVALKEYLEQAGVSGTVRFYGCPAEESGCGKERLAQAGEFDGLDVCLTWHPGDENHVVCRPYLANVILTARFRGRASHAAAAPELGRSALDACELMNVGANYLREHVPPEVKLHYAYTDCGGYSPNTVPETSGLLYYVRSQRVAEAAAIAERLRKVARGAALMTETRLSFRIEHRMYDYIPNHTLGQIMDQAYRQVGAPRFTPSDQESAAVFRQAGGEGLALSERILPYQPSRECAMVSSDVGNVSYLVPTAQLYTCCYARGTPYHSWQLVAQAKGPAAHKGMLTAAQVLALTGLRLLEEPQRISEAKQELAAALEDRPMPAGTQDPGN